MGTNVVDYPIAEKSENFKDAGSGNSASASGAMPQPKQLVGAYVALLAFMLIYFLRPEDWIPGFSAVPFAKFAGILALLGLLFSLPEIRERFPREVFYLALLIGQLFLASVFSPVWRGGALQITISLLKVLVVVVVMALAVNSLKRLRMLIFTQAASAAVMAGVTLWKGRSVEGRLEGILGGNYSDPNDLALSFVISIPLCLAFVFLARSWFWKAFWTAAIMAMTAAILETGSRGGFLALVVMAAACLWTFAIRGRRPYLIGIAALLGVVATLSFGGMVVGRLKGTFNPKDDTAAAYASTEERQHLFWRSVEVTKEHPLLGVGPGNFMQLSGNWHVAHNSFTQMSSEGGIPALLLYLVLLGCGFSNIRASKRFANKEKGTILFAKALQSSLIGFIAGSFFLSVTYAFFPYFLVAYTTSLFSIARKSAASHRKLEASAIAISSEMPAVEREEFEVPFLPSASYLDGPIGVSEVCSTDEFAQ